MLHRRNFLAGAAAGLFGSLLPSSVKAQLFYRNSLNWVRGKAGVNAVNYNGSDTILLRGADLTGNADGKVGTLSVWVLYGDDIGIDVIWDTTLGRLQLLRTASETIRVAGKNGANSTILSLDSSGTLKIADGWSHIAASWDLNTPGTGRLYINGVKDDTETTYTDDTIDYTRSDHAVGGTAGSATLVNACIAELYVNYSTYLDLDVAANLALFRTSAGKPANLGSDGSRVTGTAPIVYLPNPAASAGINKGTGGNFSPTGTFADCTTRP